MSGQENVKEGTLTEETVVEGPLVERPVNRRTVVDGTASKNFEVDYLMVKACVCYLLSNFPHQATYPVKEKFLYAWNI